MPEFLACQFAERPLHEAVLRIAKHQLQRVERGLPFQMSVLEPRLAVLDETDSGLDVDALRIVADGINALRGPERAMVLITHYQRLLNYTVPDRVHVLNQGRIVKSGDKSLALELEERGYSWLQGETASAV